MHTPTHAYLAIHDGACMGTHVDIDDLSTLDFIREAFVNGGHIERVPLALARIALFEPWPRSE